MKKFLSVLLTLLILTNTMVAYASSVEASVVDATLPYSSVTIEAGTSTSLNVKFTVRGAQDGFATFKYVSTWSLENGTLTPLTTDIVETPPKEGDTVLVHNRVVYIKVAEGQEAGIFSLNIGAFDIQNSNTNGAKLGGGSSASYDVQVNDSNIELQPNPKPTDTNAPVVAFEAAKPLANSNGWNNTAVTIPFIVTDDLSGVKSISPEDAVNFTTEGAGQTYTVTAVDNVGNSATFNSPIVNIDMTAPQVNASLGTEPNVNGWFRNDVTVNFNATDTLSGIARIDAPRTISTEGYGITVEGNAQDLAGNEGKVVLNVNLDKTAPTLSIDGVTNGAVFILKQAVTINWKASDLLSGIDITSGTVASGGNIDTASVGAKTLTFNAIDKAGNSSTVTINYKVVYNFKGILQPINSDGSSIFKLGSTVPTKFQLTDANGSFVSTAIVKLYYSKASDSVQGNVLEATSTSAATTGNLFRYDITSNQYIFNLNTKGLQTGTYKLTIALDDGMNYEVKVSLK